MLNNTWLQKKKCLPSLLLESHTLYKITVYTNKKIIKNSILNIYFYLIQK